MVENTIVNMWIPGGTSGLGKGVSDYFKDNFPEDLVITPTGKELDVRYPFFEEVDCDALIYFSGVNIDGLVREISLEDQNEIISVNCTGFINCLQACLPGMRRRGKGSILYISSYLAHRTLRGTGVYSASKAFSESIVKTIAVEEGRKGITANAIALGYFDGGMTSNVPEEILNEQLNKAPINTLGTIEDLSLTIFSLLGSSFTTGSILNMDGGISL